MANYEDSSDREHILREAQDRLEKAEVVSNKRFTSKEDRTSDTSSILLQHRDLNLGTLSKDPLISSLFSTRKPRDACAGVFSGVKSIAKGVTLGTASLLVCPVVGVSHEGLSGFLKGVGAGVLAAVTLPITGVGVASYQLMRGIINTPSAICNKASGKKWNRRDCKWQENWYSLDEEISEYSKYNQYQVFKLESENGGAVEEKIYTSRPVIDTEFYKILNVSTKATQDEIRKQYYKLAKKYHPDKNSDAKSVELFQRLGEAYQVLGDEDRRAKYDAYGKEACSDMPILDSSLFFMILFGSDSFEPFIGKLSMALYVELEIKEGAPPTDYDFEKYQTAREVKLAAELRDRVRPFLFEDGIKWKAQMETIANDLCQNSFGTAIVEAIGWTYKNYATQYLGKRETFLGITGRVAKLKEQTRSISKGLKTFGSMVKTAVAERSIKRSKGGEARNLLNEEYMKEVCESSLPMILDAMLNICLMDVQTTVRSACKKILKDMSVDMSWRCKRAEALLEMGSVFIQVSEINRRKFQTEKSQSVYDIFAQAAKNKSTKSGKETENIHYHNDAFF